MRSKLTIGFDKYKLKKFKIDENELYLKIEKLALDCGLKRTSKKVFEGGLNGEDGFVDTLHILMYFVDNNYNFLNYINEFKYEDEESDENLMETLNEYLKEVKTQ